MFTLSIFNDFCSWWWLWWILPFLLGLLLGWALWSKWKKRAEDLEDEIVSVESKIKNSENKLKECQDKGREYSSDISLLRGQLREREQDLNSTLLALKKANESAKQKPKEDKFSAIKDGDIHILEGIGPKMSEILKENGAGTLSVLASKSNEDLRKILDKFGDKYRIIDPEDWPKQAQFAANKDWIGLIEYQKLSGSDSKAEKHMVKLGILKQWEQDDLKAIEGIGPKIADLLISKGIKSWNDLAEYSPDQIQNILNAAGGRYSLADPGTWPKQAKMAANGEFDELEKYQDYLEAGKEPEA